MHLSITSTPPDQTPSPKFKTRKTPLPPALEKPKERERGSRTYPKRVSEHHALCNPKMHERMRGEDMKLYAVKEVKKVKEGSRGVTWQLASRGITVDGVTTIVDGVVGRQWKLGNCEDMTL